MPSVPNLTEIATTTARNRSAKGAKKANKSAHKEKFAGYENTSEDKAEDRKGAKKLGITPEQYEGTPQDEKEDREGMKRRGNKPSGMHVAIMIAPMHNPHAEHKASVRDSINKAVKQIKRK